MFYRLANAVYVKLYKNSLQFAIARNDISLEILIDIWVQMLSKTKLLIDLNVHMKHTL